MDDAAVIALTLYWLLNDEQFDNAIAYGHWPGGESILNEADQLRQLIFREQAQLFPDSASQIGSQLVWGVIKRIAEQGPETLWQNYWKEQYRIETA